MCFKGLSCAARRASHRAKWLRASAGLLRSTASASSRVKKRSMRRRRSAVSPRQCRRARRAAQGASASRAARQRSSGRGASAGRRLSPFSFPFSPFSLSAPAFPPGDSVLVSVLFGVPAIAVDTHVFRVSNRLGLAKGKTPEEVEEKLKKAIPMEKWSAAHHWLIWHGRKICKARKPLCGECPLAPVCPSADKEA